MDWGYVKRSSLVDALSIQLGVPRVDRVADGPDEELVGKVSGAFLRRKQVLPLGYDEDGGVLRVLMEDPADKETIADLEKTYRARIEPVMLRTDTVDHLFDELFDVWYQAE